MRLQLSQFSNRAVWMAEALYISFVGASSRILKQPTGRVTRKMRLTYPESASTPQPATPEGHDLRAVSWEIITYPFQLIA